jgi:hypothetical protein
MFKSHVCQLSKAMYVDVSMLLVSMLNSDFCQCSKSMFVDVCKLCVSMFINLCRCYKYVYVGLCKLSPCLNVRYVCVCICLSICLKPTPCKTHAALKRGPPKTWPNDGGTIPAQYRIYMSNRESMVPFGKA